jgi:PAS domain S-box-containing protein
MPAGPDKLRAAASSREARSLAVGGAFAVLSALLVAYLVILLGRHDWRFSPWLDGWSVVAFELMASALCMARAIGRRSHWRSAIVLGLACLSWTAGDLVTTLASIGNASSPSSPLADAFYLGFFPIAGFAIVSLIRGDLRVAGQRNWLDGSIAGLGMAALCAGFAFHDLERVFASASFSTAVSVAYPIGDILLLALVAGSVVVAERGRLTLALVAIGMAVNAAGDTFNFAGTPSSVAELVNAVAWPTSILIFAGSMWIGDHAARNLRIHGISSIVVPAALTCTSLLILVLGATGDHLGSLAVALATITVILAGLRLAFRDALREAREQLRWSEDRYQVLFERNPQPVVVATTETLEILAVNDALLERYGYAREELLGRDISDLAPPEDRGLVRSYYIEPTGASDAGPRRALPMRHVMRDGTVIDVEVTSNPIVLGGVPCRIALYNDVTARNRVTRELAVARDKALEASNTKSAFLANMSHEIRTPMNAVIGMTDLLLGEKLTPRQREYAEQVAVSGEQMLALINDILDVSKLETGHFELDVADFDLRETVARTCSIAAVQARAKGLRFELVIEPSVPRRVSGDARRLSQVILNLVANAVKFTPAGTVSVRVHADAASAGSRVRVEVNDTGIGIAPAALEEVFEPFTQADSSTTRLYGGTGLGLAIARDLVQLMGGSIAATSALGEGSTFTVEIELAPPAAAAAVACATAPASPGVPHWLSKPTVLVVEDGPVNQVVAVRTLERCGCRAHVVADGYEALAALAEQVFDAVLMDCQMPGLDGYETTAELRRREGGERRTPVIAMTAHAMRGDRERCLAAGMDDYVSKPLRLNDLLGALKRCIPAAQEPPAPARAGSSRPRRARSASTKRLAAGAREESTRAARS